MILNNGRGGGGGGVRSPVRTTNENRPLRKTIISNITACFLVSARSFFLSISVFLQFCSFVYLYDRRLLVEVLEQFVVFSSVKTDGPLRLCLCLSKMSVFCRLLYLNS